ncbi:MAG: sigma-70 family RNA polymerase sigma factor [Sedimentisphaerales bacterium]|nr:sigma-70 family RNA polymerase sigma factor [Sedimentisphaerales bacterium]
MKICDYGKEVDPNLVKLIVRRATQRKFPKADMDDIVQQILLALLDFRFDPAKSNGCQKSTLLIAVIDRRLDKIRRTEARYRSRQALVEIREGWETDTAEQMKVEVREAVSRLSPLQQRICAALGRGDSSRRIASDLNSSWHAVERNIAHIRSRFRTLGLDHWFGA